MEDKWKLNRQTGEKEYFLSAESFDADVEFIIRHTVSNLVVHHSKQFTKLQLQIIAGLHFLRSLHVGIPCGDLSLFESLKNLRQLTLGEGNFISDYSGFSHLEKLFIEYHKDMGLLVGLTNLQVLVFRNCKSKKFEWKKNFESLNNLKQLELTDCVLPEDFSFLANSKNLEQLEVYYNIKPFRLLGLNSCIKLKKIILSQCPKLSLVHSDLNSLHSLHWLRISDCGPIEDCSLFFDLPNLEVLIVTGKSHFVNGDLSRMFGRLKHFSFDNKRHYSHKPDDFPSVFKRV